MAWEFEPFEDGTRITNSAEGETRGFLVSLLVPLPRGNVARLTRENLDHIKTLLES